MAQGKRHIPTDKQRALVRDMSFAGFAPERICKHIEIDSETLRKHYKAELESVDHALSEVAGRALVIAKTADPKIAIPLIIFILKTRCGWRETDTAELAERIAYVIDSKASAKNKWESED